jgi:hypothetical protein
MEVWDISNPAQPAKRGDYDPAPGSIAHNVFIIGRTAYMSYYGEGIHLVDLADPTAPTRIASYRTSKLNSSGYYGAWGCYPFQDSGVIYASDIEGGFFTIQFDCGHMNRFGTGTANPAGVPRARFDGASPRVGAAGLRLELEHLTANQSYWVAVSTGPTPAPVSVLGAAVHVDLGRGVIAGPFQAAADGTARLPVAVPNIGALANSKVYLQVFSHLGNGTLSSSRGMWAGICQ